MDLIHFWTLFFLIVAGSTAAQYRAHAQARLLTRLDRKLDLILAHLDLRYEEPAHEEVRRLIASGKKLEAIKHLRSETGLGLKEAKDEVDGIEATMERLKA